jgi:hypothetical protein
MNLGWRKKMTTPTPPVAINLNNLGAPVVSRSILWYDLAVRAWGSEWRAPDHNSYQFSNGRGFDSTDTGTTGIYATDNEMGILLDGGQYPDMPRYLLDEVSVNADTRSQINQR